MSSAIIRAPSTEHQAPLTINFVNLRPRILGRSVRFMISRWVLSVFSGVLFPWILMKKTLYLFLLAPAF
jgi:hypothetical protein